MSDHPVQFLPFHAINEFMRPDFRLTIVRFTLSNLDKLPAEMRDRLQKIMRKTVSVPGFRNIDKAPAMVKVLPTAKAFEKNPDLVSGLITAWTAMHAELKTQVYEVLKQRQWRLFPQEIASPADLPPLQSEADWGVLPPDADRSRLPGFLIYWPKDQDFESIYSTYTSLYPDSSASIDEVSLMAVWLSDRLPYHIVGDEDEEPDSTGSQDAAA